jgi:UDP-glucose 4-epimerase
MFSSRQRAGFDARIHPANSQGSRQDGTSRPRAGDRIAVIAEMSGRAEPRDSLIGSMEVEVSKAIASGWRPELSLDERLRTALNAPGSG